MSIQHAGRLIEVGDFVDAYFDAGTVIRLENDGSTVVFSSESTGKEIRVDKRQVCRSPSPAEIEQQARELRQQLLEALRTQKYFPTKSKEPAAVQRGLARRSNNNYLR